MACFIHFVRTQNAVRFALISVVIFSAIQTNIAFAQTDVSSTLNNTSAGDWNDVGRWTNSPAIVAAPNNDASYRYNVTINGYDTGTTHLSLANDVTVNNLTLQNAALVGTAAGNTGSPTGPSLTVQGNFSNGNGGSFRLLNGVILNLNGQGVLNGFANVDAGDNTAINLNPGANITHTGNGVATFFQSKFSVLSNVPDPNQPNVRVYGSLDVVSGGVKINNGGTHSGIMTVHPNATLEASGDWSSPANVDDYGTFTFSTAGGSHTFSGGLYVRDNAELHFVGAGTLTFDSSSYVSYSGSNFDNSNGRVVFENQQALNLGQAHLSGETTFHNTGLSVGTLNVDGFVGNVRLETGGTVQVGTLNLSGQTIRTGEDNGHNTVVSVQNFNFSGGEVQGKVEVNGPMSWTGGNITGDYGHVIINSGGTLTISGNGGNILQYGILENHGTVYTAGNLILGNSANAHASFDQTDPSTATTINGVFGLGNDGSLTGGDPTARATSNLSGGTFYADTIILGNTTGGSASMTVKGTAAVTVGGGLAINDLIIDGSGSVTVQDRSATGDYPVNEPEVLHDAIVGGYLRDGEIEIRGGTVTSPKIKLGVTEGNTGAYMQTGGTVNVGVLGAGNDASLSGGEGSGHVSVTGGTLNADTILLGNSSGHGGGDMTVSGSAQVNVGGGMQWNDLTMNGGTLTVADSDPPANEDPVLDRSLVGGYVHEGAMYMNAGVVSTPNMKVSVDKQGTYEQNGGTISITSTLLANQGANSVVHLNGGMMNLFAATIDTGSPLSIGDGTHTFTLHLTGGEIHVTGGVAISTTGHITGTGTIVGDVTSGGVTSPGNSPGTTTIIGNSTYLSTHVLDIQLAGTTQGSEYDFVHITGDALLDGSLDLSFIPPFNWNVPDGATFTILTADGTLSGAFANIASGDRLFTFGGEGSFLVDYSDGHNVILSDFQGVPEPGSLSIFAISGLMMVRRRRQAR